jgi:tRNA G18 (ribose-2'-O)-methylase SpoU
MKSNERILIVHDIRSAQNVGSLFRTSDAVGITKVYLSSICPLPIDRFGRPRSDVAKTALGAEKTIAWEVYTDIATLITTLKREQVQVVAIEQSPQSVDYKTITIDGSVAFVLGNEVNGLPHEVLDLCDVVAEIPMKGSKESLNVAVAAGVALFGILGV